MALNLTGPKNIFRNSREIELGFRSNVLRANTKEIFVYPQDPEVAIQVEAFSTSLLSSTGSTIFQFHVPNDFNDVENVVVVIIPDATESIQFDFDRSIVSVGDTVASSLINAADITKNVTVNILTEIDIDDIGGTPTFTGKVKAGDYIGIIFKSDTTNIRVMGLRFKYT